MKAVPVLVLCCVLAACSQTSPTASGGTQAVAAAPKASRAGTDRCEQAIQGQANAAMLGGALGMAGSFGGFGGRGGMVAAQVASTAGGMVARSQAEQAQAAVMRECSRSRS